MSWYRFHKEELAGETANYISNRAYVEGMSSVQVLATVKDELFSARESVLEMLDLSGSDAAVDAWDIFEIGYMYVRSLSCCP